MQQPSNGAPMGVQFSSQQGGAQYAGPQTIPEYGEQPAEYLPEPLEAVPTRGDEGYAMVPSGAPPERSHFSGFNGRGDQIDRAMQDYFESQQDFQVDVEKVKK